jgi:Domain of unknown function (DUF4157)
MRAALQVPSAVAPRRKVARRARALRPRVDTGPGPEVSAHVVPAAEQSEPAEPEMLQRLRDRVVGAAAGEPARVKTGYGGLVDVARVPQGRGLAQRACKECEEEDAQIQPKAQRAAAGEAIEVSAPDDPYEREADRVAELVTAGPDDVEAARAAPVEEARGLAPQSVARRSSVQLQRGERATGDPEAVGEIEEEEAQGAEIQRAPAPSGASGDAAAGPLAAVLRRSRSAGEPMLAIARQRMEERFGLDFGAVRVHTGGDAASMSARLGALAFTSGRDIYFAPGQYRPGARDGDRLLAHELTHVVQQGQASPAATGAGAALGSPSGDAARGAAVIHRKPSGPAPEETFVVETPRGGNLMLRVRPDHARTLQGEDCGGAATCPNTVGNVRSGTTARIRERRQHGWCVVEAETIEHGKRVGFVHEKYLESQAAAPQEDAADGGAAEAPDVVPPEEEEGTPTFELGDAELEAMEADEGEGTPVEEFGVIQTDDGANLWPEPGRDKPMLGLLPLNTKVFLDRRLPGNWASVYVESHQRGAALPVPSGTHGFVQLERVSTDMPDPDAWLFRITKSGQGALALAAEVYPDAKPDCKLLGHACRDHRYLVNVLVAVNAAKGRKFLYKDRPNASWDEARTIKATSGPGGKQIGGQIWVPGKELVDALHDQVSSGSISLEVLATLGDITIGVAAFVAGLLHGAVSSIADVFVGVYDLIKLAVDLIVKLFKGTLISDARALWEDIKKIKASDIIAMVGAKWNAPSLWDRWKFRGYVIGYAIVEILLLVFSGGIVTAVKAAAKAGKIGKLAKYLSELGAVRRLVTAAEALKGKGVDKLRAALKAAEAISEAHGWAAQALRLPLSILRRLTELDIAKLKQLPQWARERFARLADSVKLRLLGCHSPCEVDVDKIAAALKLVAAGGKKLLSPDDVLGVLKHLDGSLKTAKISRKLRKPGSALMTAIKEAGLTDADFGALAKFLTAGDLESPAQAYKTFVRYLTSVVPAKVGPDIKELNRIAAAIVKAEVRRGSAMKGPMFEQWAALHIPELASRSFSRTTFDLRKLLHKTFPPYRRQVDTWVPDKGEIWDMKHYLGKVPTGQADDYAALVGHAADDGKVVKTINYLFPTKAAALANKHLATRYKFLVHYVDPVTNSKVRLF